MSAIAGVIRFDGGPVDPGTVEAMTAAMSHRGPDGIAHWAGAGVALGHCQFRTTPESLDETQPLTSDDESLVLVMDGRVDNWEELRARLMERGARLRTRADAELVLGAYRTFGPDFLEWIDGDFALVIWDARRRRAVCARDRTGAKPFFYRWDGSRLIFGSELRPVLDACGGERSVNEGFLAETLAADWVSRGETLWQGVRRLVAARSMTVDGDGARIERYWCPERIPLTRLATDGEYVEHYRDVLTDTVRRLSRAIGPAGYEVSGGLDSSAVFAVADRLHSDGRLPAPDIRAYTLQFQKGTGAYELDFAHAVGAHLGRTVHEIPPEIRPLGWFLTESVQAATIANFPNGIMHLGEYLRHREAGGRVFLGGIGGDQWLNAGAYDLAESLSLRAWSAAAASLRADVAAVGMRAAAGSALRRGLFPLLPGRVQQTLRRILGHPGGQGGAGGFWLSPRLRGLYDQRRTEAGREAQVRRGGLRLGLSRRLVMLDDAYTALGFEVMEGMQSAAGIEARSPYFSKSFIEMALGLPLSQLRRGKSNRYVHREAMRGLLPEIVRCRADKAEFTAAFLPCVDDLSRLQPKDVPPVSDWIAIHHLAAVQSEMTNPSGLDLEWPFGMLLCLAICDAIFDGETSLIH